MVSNTSRNGGAVMIGLNRRRTMGNSKPSYTLIDYIVNSNQNSRIITNAIPPNNANYRIVLKALVVSMNRVYGALLSSLNGTESANKIYKIRFNGDSKKLRGFAYCNTGRSLIYSSSESLEGKLLNVNLRYSTWYINGVEGGHSGSSSGTYLANNNLTLNEKTADAPIVQYYGLDVYGGWDGSGALIHQYKPCITSNGVYTMVDVLNDYICEVDGNTWSGN